jgi:hypothetical protein
METRAGTNYVIYGDNYTNIHTAFALNGSIELIVLKFNSDGIFQWGYRMGNTGADEMHSLVVDKRQNLYATVRFVNQFFIYGIDNTTIDTSSMAGSTTLYPSGASAAVVKFKQYDTIYLQPGSSTNLKKVITNTDSNRVYIDCTKYTTVKYQTTVVNCIQLNGLGSSITLWWMGTYWLCEDGWNINIFS